MQFNLGILQSRVPVSAKSHYHWSSNQLLQYRLHIHSVQTLRKIEFKCVIVYIFFNFGFRMEHCVTPLYISTTLLHYPVSIEIIASPRDAVLNVKPLINFVIFHIFNTYLRYILETIFSISTDAILCPGAFFYSRSMIAYNLFINKYYK